MMIAMTASEMGPVRPAAGSTDPPLAEAVGVSSTAMAEAKLRKSQELRCVTLTHVAHTRPMPSAVCMARTPWGRAAKGCVRA